MDFEILPIIALTAKAMRGDRENASMLARVITSPSPSILIVCLHSCALGCTLDEAMSPNPSAKEADEKVSILIVDDRPDKLLAYEVILAELNENLVRARSGKEALRCLLQQDFAVILLT